MTKERRFSILYYFYFSSTLYYFYEIIWIFFPPTGWSLDSIIRNFRIVIARVTLISMSVKLKAVMHERITQYCVNTIIRASLFLYPSPMQLRGPSPKAIKVIGCILRAFSGINLSELNVYGSSQNSGLWCKDQTGIWMAIPAGMTIAFARYSSAHSRITNLNR